MAWQQGIYFRATDNQVDPTGYDAEVATTANYLRVPGNGDSDGVGWETLGGTVGEADRDATTDVRLKGIQYRSNVGGAVNDYRIDLPNTGTYRIRLAMGDSSGQQNVRCQLLDGTTVFLDLEGNTITSTNWFDAAQNLRTSEADWVSNNEAIEQTFTTTIFRIRIGAHSAGSGNSTIAAVHIEEVPSVLARIMFRGS